MNQYLISSDELQEEIDFAMDHFGPNFRDKPAHRRILEALLHAQIHIEAFENAARKRAAPSLLPLVAEMFAPLRQQEKILDSSGTVADRTGITQCPTSDGELARLRGTGAI